MSGSDHEESVFNLRRHKAMSLGAGLNKIHLGDQGDDDPDGHPQPEQVSFLHSKCK